MKNVKGVMNSTAKAEGFLYGCVVDGPVALKASQMLKTAEGGSLSHTPKPLHHT